jgi:hypothetical protein
MCVTRLAKHHWAHCHECNGCHLCRGGLGVCTVCHGIEGSLATDCPGERMTFEQDQAVYAGTLDFTRRDGWIEIAPKKENV